MSGMHFSPSRVLERLTDERGIRLEVLSDTGSLARDDEQVVFKNARIHRFLLITAITTAVHEHMMRSILLRSIPASVVHPSDELREIDFGIK